MSFNVFSLYKTASSVGEFQKLLEKLQTQDLLNDTLSHYLENIDSISNTFFKVLPVEERFLQLLQLMVQCKLISALLQLGLAEENIDQGELSFILNIVEDFKRHCIFLIEAGTQLQVTEISLHTILVELVQCLQDALSFNIQYGTPIKKELHMLIYLEINQQQECTASALLRRKWIHLIIESLDWQQQEQFWQTIFQLVVSEEIKERLDNLISLLVVSMRDPSLQSDAIETLIRMKKIKIVHCVVNQAFRSQDMSLQIQSFQKGLETHQLQVKGNPHLYGDLIIFQYCILGYLQQNRQLCINLFKRNLLLFSNQTLESQREILATFLQTQLCLYQCFKQKELGNYLVQAVNQINQIPQKHDQINFLTNQIQHEFGLPLMDDNSPWFTFKIQDQIQHRYKPKLILQTQNPIIIEKRFESFEQMEKIHGVFKELKSTLMLKSPQSKEVLKYLLKKAIDL